jgi:hypothetical protein
VNKHCTRGTAEAPIRRKQQDYGEIRVYVDSQYYAWEFVVIKEAILDGTLTYRRSNRKCLIPGFDYFESLKTLWASLGCI